MQRIIRLLMSMETLIAGLATVVVVGSVIWGVLTRYVTEQPAVWTAELSGLLFTWIVFLGAAASFHADQHIRVTLLVDKMPLSTQSLVKRFVELYIIVFLIIAAYLSYAMMLKGATRPSPVLRIPFSYVYLAPLIAFSLMAFNATLRLFGWTEAVSDPNDVGEAVQ